MRLSIIIVNYNVKAFLEQCLYSVRAAARGAGFTIGEELEVMVIDNASTDGSRDYLPSRFPEVQFEWMDENLGFGKANNRGLRTALGENILFLNPDTLLQEDTIRVCLQWLDTHPVCGALGVRMIDGSGRFLPESKRGFPTVSASFFKLTGMSSRFSTSKLFAAYYAGHLSPHQNQVVEVLAGAFMMVRKTVIEKTGGFDEAFFMYAEDIDLSFRIQQAGYENHYLADTRILHFKGESSLTDKVKHTHHFYLSMQLFYEKHFRDTLVYPFQKGLIQLGIQLNRWHARRHWQAEEAKTPSSPKIDLNYHTAGSLQGLPAHSTVLLLPSNSLSYQSILDLIEAQGTQFNFMIAASGSTSMVGSSAKNKLGHQWIATNPYI